MPGRSVTTTVMTTMGMTTAQAVTASNRISVRSMGAVPSVTLFTGSSQHTRTSVIEEALDGTFGERGGSVVALLAVHGYLPNRDNGPTHTSLRACRMRRMPQARRSPSMTPPVSTFRVERPCGRLWRRARYGSAPPASRVADAIAARRPAAALDLGASANPGAGDAGRPGPARLGRAAPCGQVSRSVPRQRVVAVRVVRPRWRSRGVCRRCRVCSGRRGHRRSNSGR